MISHCIHAKCMLAVTICHIITPPPHPPVLSACSNYESWDWIRNLNNQKHVHCALAAFIFCTKIIQKALINIKIKRHVYMRAYSEIKSDEDYTSFHGKLTLPSILYSSGIHVLQCRQWDTIHNLTPL